MEVLRDALGDALDHWGDPHHPDVEFLSGNGNLDARHGVRVTAAGHAASLTGGGRPRAAGTSGGFRGGPRGRSCGSGGSRESRYVIRPRDVDARGRSGRREDAMLV